MNAPTDFVPPKVNVEEKLFQDRYRVRRGAAAHQGNSGFHLSELRCEALHRVLPSWLLARERFGRHRFGGRWLSGVRHLSLGL